jgi:phosphohistidine phosphatase SixA
MDSTLELTSKGVRDAKLMRQFRKDLDIKFDVAFVSDFVRCQQTADVVVNKKAPRFDMKELRPNCTPEEAFIAMHKAFPELAASDKAPETSVYICTHNPLIQAIAGTVWFGFNPDVNNFSHGTMLRIDTHELPPEKHPLHWIIRPGLVEHMYESDLVESATQLVEHLGRASKARIVDPLIASLQRAVGRRFKKQGEAYTTTGRIWPAFDEASRFRTAFGRVSSKSYDAGVAHVAGALGVNPAPVYAGVTEAAKLNLKRQPPGHERTAVDLESEIDATTQERIAAIESDGVAKGLTAAAIATAIRQQFREWAGGRALTIAEAEVSRAFHQGGADVARIVNQEGGGHLVEKAWDGEPDACDEICMPNIEDGWIPEDILFQSGDSEPPGHPNCRCSLSYRTVGQSEEARR